MGVKTSYTNVTNRGTIVSYRTNLADIFFEYSLKIFIEYAWICSNMLEYSLNRQTWVLLDGLSGVTNMSDRQTHWKSCCEFEKAYWNARDLVHPSTFKTVMLAWDYAVSAEDALSDVSYCNKNRALYHL
jgi:hypothetical protein